MWQLIFLVGPFMALFKLLVLDFRRDLHSYYR